MRRNSCPSRPGAPQLCEVSAGAAVLSCRFSASRGTGQAARALYRIRTYIDNAIYARTRVAVRRTLPAPLVAALRPSYHVHDHADVTFAACRSRTCLHVYARLYVRTYRMTSTSYHGTTCLIHATVLYYR